MDHTVKKTTRPPYGLLAVLMVGAFITFLNNTLLNVALPSIMTDLHVNTATVQWLSTVFMLVSGIMIPTTAFLIQKYSVRHLFLAAMGLFTIGTIIGGIAHIFPLLLAARVVQAAGAAIMMPVLMNVMLVSFPIEKRGTAMGVFGLIIMFAPAIGPTLSGWIVEHYSWRMLFMFIAPISLLIFLIGFFLLKDKKEKVDIRLDLLSVVLSSLGFGGLLYGFSSAGNAGWGSPQVYLSLMIGVITLTLFILRQSKLEEPMLSFAVFKFPSFTLASIIIMILNMALFSGFLMLPIYAQAIRGISPMDTGLMLLPGAVLNAFLSPITGRLFDKYGGRVLAVIGLTITTVATYFFSQLTFETSYTSLIVLHALRMLGMALIFMPVSTNGLNELPTRFYPHGTAMNNTLNQVSGAIGTALLVTIMTIRTESASVRLLTEAAGQQTAGVQQHIAMQAMLEGINFAFLVATFITAGALVLSFFMKRATQAEDKSGRPSATESRAKLAEN
ncbi:DHA2 family efflux MFS transporter permease subunit [Bacillus benzoevorans]|uniref:EmrB/QacA subfamily drug resistance transporter n=1 Tax=Bacillus benzoevorans TaxID=1456 RepID=A0A7X0LWF2_9BACI|nr:DHA2 family efflux MFS transporter permease subunit [Bacillus benzoevorans]MBB6446996.1 EmrB/QacA subfamily drug resistance transporter [Bacillus benzoevorans]